MPQLYWALYATLSFTPHLPAAPHSASARTPALRCAAWRLLHKSEHMSGRWAGGGSSQTHCRHHCWLYPRGCSFAMMPNRGRDFAPYHLAAFLPRREPAQQPTAIAKPASLPAHLRLGCTPDHTSRMPPHLPATAPAAAATALHSALLCYMPPLLLPHLALLLLLLVALLHLLPPPPHMVQRCRLHRRQRSPRPRRLLLRLLVPLAQLPPAGAAHQVPPAAAASLAGAAPA